MDTRFWGPPAWILLHTLAYHYKPELKDYYMIFFGNLKYVLPCIYCRASFTEYTEILPIDGSLKSRDQFFEWLYKIHNMVNDKLRGQGLIQWMNPKYEDIVSKYKNIALGLKDCKTRDQSIMGWNFLYCIAFVYPEKGVETSLTSHYHGYISFFNSLANILPEDGGYRQIYKDYLVKNPILKSLTCREKLKLWVYNLEKTFNDFQKVQCIDFSNIEELIEGYRAGCGGTKKDKQPTCRKIK